MRKLLQQNLHRVKYAFIGVSVQCFSVGVSWASDTNSQPKSSDHIALIAEPPGFRGSSQSVAQQERTITGKVVLSDMNQGMPGVSVHVKGASVGTVTNATGSYTLRVPSEETVLVFSFIGYVAKEVTVGNRTELNVTLDPDVTSLQEVVVVGYGEQKKESVIAAITQTKGEVLERAGGVQTIGAALTGNVPGVVTTASTGMPGEEDPRIVIRGTSSLSGASPLILVDGIERPMNSVDISSVESVSVLKDASATAVYGVRGANGVILITTKRGTEGKAQIRARVQTTVKSPSKLPGKADAYDTYIMRNRVIENELSLRPAAWADYRPQAIIDKYRNPADQEELERYPNIDWQKELFKDYAMAYNANVNVTGGTKLVKYFTSIDYLQENDLFKVYDNNRGYESGYGFNRVNVRSNLDFQLTPTTVLRSNLSGSYGVQKRPRINLNEYNAWISAYNNAPDVFYPQYADGSWGYYAPNASRAENSMRVMGTSGVRYTTTTRLNTDFTLDQNLDFITKGLKFAGTIAFDNTFVERDRGINDANNPPQEKWIDPVTGMVSYRQAFDTNNRFDFQEAVAWTTTSGGVDNGATQRRLFYQAQINYATTLWDKHNITSMGLFNRNELAYGSEVPRYREDWVYRATYNYDGKYMFEYNGAYTGSEKFSSENRFAFFQSGGVGWLISNEKFMEPISFMDYLKVRANYGQIGDDSGGGRFLFMSNWAYGGQANFGTVGEGGELSPYTWYRESSVGNPELQWETVTKANIGVEFGFFKGLIKGSVDYFNDRRKDILLVGNSRAIPFYYGGVGELQAPTVNDGRVQNRGFEYELNLNYTFGNGLYLWSNMNMTHARNKIIEADDPLLLPEYQKRADKRIGQAYSYVGNGYYNTWDELYASTIHDQNDLHKLPGNYHIIDFNGDGVINAEDNIPYGYSGTPENTYNATVGFEWKGFSGFVQFYGVNNVTRQVVFNSFGSQNNVVYDEGSYWSKDNPNADTPLPRWNSTPAGYYRGHQYMFDGSYIRLKNLEIAYTLNSSLVRRIGMSNVRIFANGNNLFLWTKMPDDRESNFAGTGWASQGAYPTVKRYNVGANITF
ncbi:TonB-dependent receptor [Pontibacter sp. SGAir0037]|uniref:SusC/RagA family TonB-linked outer membrane protein n=1 Tax=Pontibacter sp. SGAir0037 TaxID=2571030 RepID=UPI0010CD3CEC|nr:TonB-dependent receptor [Pontibacter sp. SGAir0037]QCR22376.1 SusC/RagA family TonB-linked outer membrane protein [Pontibacter sp. SGAir0037]